MSTDEQALLTKVLSQQQPNKVLAQQLEEEVRRAEAERQGAERRVSVLHFGNRGAGVVTGAPSVRRS